MIQNLIRLMNRRTTNFSLFVTFQVVTLCSLTRAADIEALQFFDFGVMAIPSNENPSTYQIPYTGEGISVEGTIYPIETGQPGQYRLTGLPPNTSLVFNWPDEITLQPGGPTFAEPLLVTDFTNPDRVTNSAGEVEFPVGATLATTGNDVAYFDTVYSGTVSLQIQHWSPPAKQYVTKSFNLDIQAEPRTAISMDEIEPLQFGTIAAYSDDDKIATMTITPKGKISLTKAGDARITPIHEAEPGLVQVIGAAPFHDMNIDTTQADTVYLSHKKAGTASARFLVEDFKTLPADQGRTDRDGNLEIHVGATLKTEKTSKKYQEGDYEGQYELTVSY